MLPAIQTEMLTAAGRGALVLGQHGAAALPGSEIPTPFMRCVPFAPRGGGPQQAALAAVQWAHKQCKAVSRIRKTTLALPA